MHHFVSIHAPAWGATAVQGRAGRLFASFNPRTRVGCDAIIFGFGMVSLVFQSTHPRGVRHSATHVLSNVAEVSIHAPAWGATSCTSSKRSAKASFNPRTRVGCDLVNLMLHLPEALFQSTHPRGVRPGFTRHQRELTLFQSTHPRGVRRPFGQYLTNKLRVSIHAPAWGATVSMFYPVDSRD